MVNLRRIERRTEITLASSSVTLIETNWYLSVGRNSKGAAFSYQAPTAVESDGEITQIRDHVMWARLAALILITALTLGIRRRERQ